MPPSCRHVTSRQESRQNGLTDWGYLPHQWQQANAVYPLLLRQGRVNDGVGAYALLPALLPESDCSENETTAGR